MKENSNNKHFRTFIALMIILVVAVIAFITISVIELAQILMSPETKEESNINYNELFLEGRYKSPYFPQIALFVALTDAELGLVWKIDLKYPELYNIIRCESEWNPENRCNKQYGCMAGMGLAMFIPTTWNYVKLNDIKVADPFNIEDNLRAAMRLYSNEGNKHWKQSATCWQT